MLRLTLLDIIPFVATFIYLKKRDTHTALALLAGIVWLPFWLVVGWRRYQKHLDEVARRDPGGIR
jgi:hypothetical protein